MAEDQLLEQLHLHLATLTAASVVKANGIEERRDMGAMLLPALEVGAMSREVLRSTATATKSFAAVDDACLLLNLQTPYLLTKRDCIGKMLPGDAFSRHHSMSDYHGR